MAAFSDYLETAIANWLRGTAFPAEPTNTHVALFTSDPADDASGTEVSGGSYARVALAQADWNAPVASGGGQLIDNAVAVTFPTATASWGTVTHVGLFDASTGGNLLYHGALASSKAVGDGDTFEIAAGDLDITIGS